jgi:hypothetical protein
LITFPSGRKSHKVESGTRKKELRRRRRAAKGGKIKINPSNVELMSMHFSLRLESWLCIK